LENSPGFLLDPLDLLPDEKATEFALVVLVFGAFFLAEAEESYV